MYVCISYGVFSDSLKLSVIKPIIKSKNVRTIEIVRPISILPYISKIFEKIIHLRIVSFIEKFNLINEHNLVSGIKNHHFMQFKT